MALYSLILIAVVLSIGYLLIETDKAPCGALLIGVGLLSLILWAVLMWNVAI